MCVYAASNLEKNMHLVETMAYAGEKPWHGLGRKLPVNESIDVWKRSAGMDWQIEESEHGVAIHYRLQARPSFPLPDMIMRGLFRRAAADLLGQVCAEIERRAALAAL